MPTTQQKTPLERFRFCFKHTRTRIFVFVFPFHICVLATNCSLSHCVGSQCDDHSLHRYADVQSVRCWLDDRLNRFIVRQYHDAAAVEKKLGQRPAPVLFAEQSIAYSGEKAG